MPLKPWYKEVEPRDDLKEGKPLDASEFAVHLDDVREGRAPVDYRDPERFFDRTVLTDNLKGLGAEVVRRLSGIRVQTSSTFNLTTQFGGGKTHALTMLYHLAKNGAQSARWRGVDDILKLAGVQTAPSAAVAVFVGTQFDGITGRGESGEPRRYTPWGEIAWQLGREKAFAIVAKHDEARQAPSAEVIRQILPKNEGALILMDELLHFINRERRSGMSDQLYAFIQALTEEARGQDRLVVAISLPSLLDEMTPQDEQDHARFEKWLDRLAKTYVMSAGAETSEIIRRRLFTWGGLTKDAVATTRAYAEWVQTHKTQLLGPTEDTLAAFQGAYPFHPALLSVFERKWQQLHRFQQTRGILRLLSMWVSAAWRESTGRGPKDPLITMGSAPFEDTFFRQAVFEQLGAAKLEGALTTDICGRPDSHAVRLDAEAAEEIKKAKLHRRAATAIFFESNGGQTKAEAVEGEITFAVGGPELDIGNVATALDALSNACYYLTRQGRGFRFSLTPNLNKLLSDRRAGISPKDVDDTVKAEVQSVWKAKGDGVERAFFPSKSSDVRDIAALTVVVLAPDEPPTGPETRAKMESFTREHGASNRTFKSALIWIAADSGEPMREEARKVLAWKEILADRGSLRLEDGQEPQIRQNIARAEKDLTEAVWRAYKHVFLLGKNDDWKSVDVGTPNSSQSASVVDLVLSAMRAAGDREDQPGPAYLVRNWPPAFTEWPTKAVRDAFFASPALIRILRGDVLKDTIARGVQDGHFAYVGRTPSGDYKPFHFQVGLAPRDVELSEDMFVIKAETADAHIRRSRGETVPAPVATVPTSSGATRSSDGAVIGFPVGGAGEPDSGRATVPSFAWSGQIPPQKWMNFYTKVLTRFSNEPTLRLTLKVEVAPSGGLAAQKVDEAKVALRELGLDDE
jgi:hypothetical protein